MNRDQLREIIEKAKAQIAAKALLKTPSQQATKIVTTSEVVALTAPVNGHAVKQWLWNEEQNKAIQYGLQGISFVLIGAAGTGKTTTLRGLLQACLHENSMSLLRQQTKWLEIGSPGVALVSYTRRAVRNIVKQMPEELKTHCLTIHKLLEYSPEKYEVVLENGDIATRNRFVPTRNSTNPLPRDLKKIVIDESSMVDTQLMGKLVDALPDPTAVQFIFLGDLNQLPPVYGQAILGMKLLELPIVELTQVYRQALESPIISLALAVKNNNFSTFNRDVVELWCPDQFKKPDGKPDYFAFDAKEIKQKTVIERKGRGKVTLHPWKKQLDQEEAAIMMRGQLNSWIRAGEYNPDEDLVLCPQNINHFGTDELNKSIATTLGRNRNEMVYEIIAGFSKFYWAVGDKLMIEKEEAIILSIEANPRYLGAVPAKPSKLMDRWGNNSVQGDVNDYASADIEDLIVGAADPTERVAQASHIVRVRFLDSGEEESIDKANTINNSNFAYAITVHKAQGSECRKVFVLTHWCHSRMCFRELIYTAITRAAEELYIVLTPYMLATAAKRPRIKGDTLADKLKWFQSKFEEMADD